MIISWYPNLSPKTASLNWFKISAIYWTSVTRLLENAIENTNL